MIAAIRTSLRWGLALCQLITGRRANDRRAEHSHGDPIVEEVEEYFDHYESEDTSNDYVDEVPPSLDVVCEHLSRCHKRYRQINLGGGSMYWSVAWHDPDDHEDSEPVAFGRFGGRVADLPMPQVTYGTWDYSLAVFTKEDASRLLAVGTVVGMVAPLEADLTDLWPELN
jgi:hypothetical protein